MPYATFDQVIRNYSPLTTLVGTMESQVSTVDISSIFIANGEALINGYIMNRYITIGNEPLLTKINCDLAIADILMEKLGEVPPFMQSRYDRAIKQLEQIRDGEIVLVGSGTAATDGGDNEAWSSTQSFHSIFSPVLRPESQKVDLDRVEADLAERT